MRKIREILSKRQIAPTWQWVGGRPWARSANSHPPWPPHVIPPDVSTRAAVLRISLDLDGNRAEAQNSPHAVVR